MGLPTIDIAHEDNDPEVGSVCDLIGLTFRKALQCVGFASGVPLRGIHRGPEAHLWACIVSCVEFL